VRIFSVGPSLAGAGLLGCVLAVATSAPSWGNITIATEIVESAPAASFETFLDHLMGAESTGRKDAKNPRSTALGAFQFIKSTFLEVTRRHFPAEVAGLKDDEILALRTDPQFSRRAAAAFSRDNIGHLKRQGLDPTFAHLRLAFLLGAADAVRLIQAEPQTKVVQILSAAAIKANPFMAQMTAADLLAKGVRDVERDRAAVLVQKSPEARSRPGAYVRPIGGPNARQFAAARRENCNQKHVSCRGISALNPRKGAPSRAARGKA
jgi:hypothetical protein